MKGEVDAPSPEVNQQEREAGQLYPCGVEVEIACELIPQFLQSYVPKRILISSIFPIIIVIKLLIPKFITLLRKVHTESNKKRLFGE
jgi:hypothetical protein